MDSNLADRSKKLSYLLRHKPETAGLTLDREGWCLITELIEKTDFRTDELFQIVAEDAKGRYSISPCVERIRANQGHSTSEVKLTFKTATPPPELFHGANQRALPDILKTGLLPMRRHHVHLSRDKATATAVGQRNRNGFMLLTIDAKAMLAAGHKFYISDNGVWLVDHVPTKYLKEAE